jgi:FemAB-related protein (PEP-CTERM system-associated)
MSVTCRFLTPATAPAWDAFVAAMPQATFFHRAAWAEVIARAFGHRVLHLYAERDGAITGILPLVHLKSRLFGSALVSTPFCVYGGPVAADAESEAALIAHADGLARDSSTRVVEFRYLDAAATEDPGAVERADLYVTFRRAIAADDEANLKAIPRKQRAMVRKGIANGLTSVADRDTDRLHRIYAESVRNLGTPVFPRRYFRILAEAFPECCDVVTILDDDTPIAAVLNFYFRDQVLPYYGGGTQHARGRAGNDFMYWEVMRRAAARGARLFDFGRSKRGTGAFAFKHNWGFEPAPLHYRFRLAPGAVVPDHNPLNPKYRLFIAAWKRLPLPLANALGPHIVRGIG